MMGNKFARTSIETNESKRGLKRKREDSESQESKNEINNLEILNTPKRKKIKSTSKYIYQTLFLDGENSDVSIRALGKEWKLHKLYLKQSPYFASMFNGVWKESDMEFVNIEVADENITEDSLKLAFGSLYKDDIIFKPVQLVGVLAAATLLQLDALIQQCVMMMNDTLSSCTACTYYYASSTYGLEDTRQLCFDWLTRNILVVPTLTFIKDINVPLMKEIVSSPSLCVMQLEIDIYSLLKKWIFLLHNPSWTGGNLDLIKAAQKYFKEHVTEGQSFLESEEGKQYIPVFSEIRWHHVVNDIASIRMMENDNILPIKWLDPMFLYGWRRVLHVEQGLDLGPAEEISESVFNSACTRCGRILAKEGSYCWRWVGYSYGIDLHVSLSNRLVTVKRNTQTESCPQAVSLQAVRHLCYRISIASLDENGKVKCTQTSGLKKISMGKDEENIAIMIDKKMEYPLCMSMNLMLLSPMPELPIPRLKIPDT